MTQEKIDIKAVLIVILLISLFLNFFPPAKSSSDIMIAEYSRPNSFSAQEVVTQSTTCSFKRVDSVSFKDKISFNSDSQDQDVTIAFLDLDTKTPKVKGNNGQANLIKVIDSENNFTLIEEEPITFGTVNVYTIFKKERVATWTKQYELITIPYASLSMGYCD